MALITCHECGHTISSTATACPSCGAAVKRSGAARKALAAFSALGFGLVAAVVAGTVFVMSGTEHASVMMTIAFVAGAAAGWFRVMR